METKIFICGLFLGMIGGALIVANSKCAKDTIEKGQDFVKSKAEEITANQKKQKKETQE